jgi:hypothetical protein
MTFQTQLIRNFLLFFCLLLWKKITPNHDYLSNTRQRKKEWAFYSHTVAFVGSFSFPFSFLVTFFFSFVFSFVFSRYIVVKGTRSRSTMGDKPTRNPTPEQRRNRSFSLHTPNSLHFSLLYCLFTLSRRKRVTSRHDHDQSHYMEKQDEINSLA